MSSREHDPYHDPRDPYRRGPDPSPPGDDPPEPDDDYEHADQAEPPPADATAPPTAPTYAAHGAEKWRPYRSPGALSVAAVVLVIIAVVLGVASAAATVAVNLMVIAPGAYVHDEASGPEMAEGCVRLLWLVSMVVGGIVFLVWQHRVSSNLQSLGAEGQRHTPGWSVAYWFIPVLNLFRPWQAVHEAWERSRPSELEAEGEDRGSGAVIGAWWVLWIGAGVLAIAASRVAPITEQNPEAIAVANWLNVASDVLHVLAGVLVIQIVLAITHNQRAVARHWGFEPGH